MRKFIYTILICFILVLIVFLLLPKETIKNALLDLAIKKIESSTDARIEIDGSSFEYPFILKIHSFKISQSNLNYPWLEAEDVSISLNPLAFLYSKLSIRDFRCKSLSISSLPESKTTSQPVDLSQLHLSLKISHFTIGSFKVSPKVAEKLGLVPYINVSEIQRGVPVHGLFSAKTFFPSTKLELYVGTSSNPVSSIIFSIHKQMSDYVLLASLYETPNGIFNKPGSLKFSTLKGSIEMSGDEQWDGTFKAIIKNKDHPIDGHLEGHFNYFFNGLFNLDRLEGNFKFGLFSGKARFSPQFELSESEFHATLLPFTYNEDLQINTPINMEVALSGPILSPSVQGVLSTQAIQLNEWMIKQPEIALNINFWDPESTGWIKFSADYKEHHIQGSSDLVIQDQNFYFSNFSTGYANALIDGNLIVTPSLSPAIKGSIKGINLSLEDFDPKWKGVGNFHADFDHNADYSQTAFIDLWMENVTWQDMTLAKARSKIKAYNLFTTPHATVEVKLNDGRMRDTLINELTFETNFNETLSSNFSLLFSGHLNKPFKLSTGGHWQLINNENFTLEVTSLTGDAFNFPLELIDPFIMKREGEHINLSPLFISIGPGSFYSTADFTPDFFQSALRIQNIPLEISHLFAPHFPLKGLASGQIFLFGSPEQPRGQLECDLTQVKLEEEAFNHFPPLQIALQASLIDQTFECVGQIAGIQSIPLQAKASIPLNFSLLPFSMDIMKDLPLFGSLKGQGPISPILSLFVVDKTSLEGDADLHLGIEGTFNRPKVSGYAHLKNGFFESLETGAVLRSIEAKISGAGENIILEHFTAYDEAKGIINGKGKISLDHEQKFPFEMHLELNQATLLNIEFVKTTASGNVKLVGNKMGGLLSGTLTSNKTQMTIPDQIPALTQSVEVIYINQPKNEPLPNSFQKKKATWPLKLNLELQFPSKATLKAKDLNSEWNGNLFLKGTTDDPLLEGQLNVVKGDYLLNGKKFILKEGSATFAGDPMTESSLYVVGALDLGKIVAELILKGPIKNLTISLTSNPPLPQQEILSWILFGKGLSEISPYQGDQLTASLADLSQDSNEPDLLTKFRNRTGIDRIDINRSGEGDSGDVSFEVGKYITQGTYVSVSKNMGSETNEVNIETSIFRNFKLQAGVSDDANGHFDIIWKYDY